MFWILLVGTTAMDQEVFDAVTRWVLRQSNPNFPLAVSLSPSIGPLAAGKMSPGWMITGNALGAPLSLAQAEDLRGFLEKDLSCVADLTPGTLV